MMWRGPLTFLAVCLPQLESLLLPKMGTWSRYAGHLFDFRLGLPNVYSFCFPSYTYLNFVGRMLVCVGVFTLLLCIPYDNRQCSE